ncbi:MAG TPA: BrnT family toxin [Dehalococcoidia bacterium]|nr:BrnT family toxin [Dehalococcoidia bacterium]
MKFEWDEAKNERNIAQHHIDFVEAKLSFEGNVLAFVDDRRDYGETRIVAIGLAEGRELTVVYTMRGDVVRIISARRARRDERRAYREKYPE